MYKAAFRPRRLMLRVRVNGWHNFERVHKNIATIIMNMGRIKVYVNQFAVSKESMVAKGMKFLSEITANSDTYSPLNGELPEQRDAKEI